MFVRTNSGNWLNSKEQLCFQGGLGSAGVYTCAGSGKGLVLRPSAGSSVSWPGYNVLMSESEQTHQVLSHKPFQSWETLELSG